MGFFIGAKMKKSNLQLAGIIICVSLLLSQTATTFGMGDKPPETKAAAASVVVTQAVKATTGDTSPSPPPASNTGTGNKSLTAAIAKVEQAVKVTSGDTSPSPSAAVVLPDNIVRLISNNGGKLILIDPNPYLVGNAGAGLIGNTAGGLAGNSGGALTGNTGATLAGNSGGALTGNTGATLIGNTAGGLTGNYSVASQDKQSLPDLWGDPKGYADEQGNKYVVLQKTDGRGNMLEQYFVRTLDSEGKIVSEAKKTPDGKMLAENTWVYDTKGQAIIAEKKDSEGRTLEKSFVQDDGGLDTYRYRPDGSEYETERRSAKGAIDIEYKNEKGETFKSTHISKDPDGQYAQIAVFEGGKFERVRNYLDGSREVFKKEPDGSRQELRVSAYGTQTLMAYDRDSHLIKETKANPQGATEKEQTWIYNPDGTVHSDIKDGSGKQLESIIKQADGTQETTRYSPEGSPLHTEKTNADGSALTSYFAGGGSLEKQVLRSKESNAAVEKTIWPNGREESVRKFFTGATEFMKKEADGSKEITVTKNYGRPLSEPSYEGEDPSSRRRTYRVMETKQTYDTAGRLVSEAETRAGRKTSEKNMAYGEDGTLTTTVFDGEGKLLEKVIKNSAGNATTVKTDGDTEKHASVSAASGGNPITTPYAYDANGKLLSGTGSGSSISEDGFGNTTTSQITQTYTIKNGQARLEGAHEETQSSTLIAPSKQTDGNGSQMTTIYRYDDKGKLQNTVGSGSSISTDGFGNTTAGKVSQAFVAKDGQAQIAQNMALAPPAGGAMQDGSAGKGDWKDPFILKNNFEYARKHLEEKIQFAKKDVEQYEKNSDIYQKNGDAALVSEYKRMAQQERNKITEIEAVLKNPNWIPGYMAKALEESRKYVADSKSPAEHLEKEIKYWRDLPGDWEEKTKNMGPDESFILQNNLDNARKRLEEKIQYTKEQVEECEKNSDISRKRGDEALANEYKQMAQQERNKLTEIEAVLKNPNGIPGYMAKDLEDSKRLGADTKTPLERLDEEIKYWRNVGDQTREKSQSKEDERNKEEAGGKEEKTVEDKKANAELSSKLTPGQFTIQDALYRRAQNGEVIRDAWGDRIYGDPLYDLPALPYMQSRVLGLREQIAMYEKAIKDPWTMASTYPEFYGKEYEANKKTLGKYEALLKDTAWADPQLNQEERQVAALRVLLPNQTLRELTKAAQAASEESRQERAKDPEDLLANQAREIDPVSNPPARIPVNPNTGEDLEIDKQILEAGLVSTPDLIPHSGMPQDNLTPAVAEANLLEQMQQAELAESSNQVQNEINQMIREIETAPAASIAEEVRQNVTEDRIVQQTATTAQLESSSDDSGVAADPMPDDNGDPH